MSTERKDLIRFGEYARERANWRPTSSRRAPCADHTAFGMQKPLDCANCAGCGHLCHQPTSRERELWQKLAAEIEAYLGDDDTDRLAQDTLFGGGVA